MLDESYFTFKLGEGTFAIPVANVREVLNYEPVTKVPKALSYLKGVINIRGSVVTVADLRELFGFKSEVDLEKSSIIVLEIEQENEAPFVLGILADSVNVVTKLEEVKSENFDFGTLPERKEFISSIARNNDNFVLIMDIKKILSSIEKELQN